MSPTRKKLLPLAVVVLLLCSCASDGARTDAGVVVDTLPNGALHVRNTAAGVWALTGSEPWRVEEVLRIGQFEGDPRYMFGSLRNVIPTADGNVWALDSQAAQLRLYDADGQILRTVGRSGDGPGEFAANPCAFAGPNGEVWVEDVRRRWQRFSADGDLLGQFQSTSNLGCGRRELTADDRLYVVNIVQGSASPVGRSNAFYVVYGLDESDELVALDTISVPELPSPPAVVWVTADGRGRISTNLPFTQRSTWTVGRDGSFWFSSADGRYVLQNRSAEGDTIRLIEREFEPVTIPAAVRDSAIRAFRREGMTAENGFDPGQVPGHHPPYDQINVADDGHLWVRYQRSVDALGLDVFSPDGRYLGPVEVPGDFDRMFIHHITATDIYGVVRDDLDVQYIVRLAITRPAG